MICSFHKIVRLARLVGGLEMGKDELGSWYALGWSYIGAVIVDVSGDSWYCSTFKACQCCTVYSCMGTQEQSGS